METNYWVRIYIRPHRSSADAWPSAAYRRPVGAPGFVAEPVMRTAKGADGRMYNGSMNASIEHVKDWRACEKHMASIQTFENSGGGLGGAYAPGGDLFTNEDAAIGVDMIRDVDSSL